VASKETILVVDDDPVTVQILSSHLRERGFNVAAAADAMQAVMYSLRGPLSAIFLDIKLPGGTGLDVLKKLKSSMKTTHIPVIIITGLDDPELPQKARELGADEFLRKPLDLPKITQVLKRLLGEPMAGG
jgi:two-component system cell cycle response regulator